MSKPQEQIFRESIELEIFADLNQDIIATTEDKLRLCLDKHVKGLGRKKEWITSSSIFITVITIFATAEFQEFIVPADTWKAMFIIIGIASFVWLLFSLKYAFGKNEIDKLIEDLKNKKT